jgi:GWxTD domain-containing protein
VDLCSSIEPSTDKKDPFYKNSYSVIPNPSLFFGATGIPVVFTYAELYDLVPGMPYSLALEVLDGKNQVLKSRVRSRQFSIRNAVDVSTLNVAGIQSGKFRFVLRISDSTGKEIARTEKPIFVFNPGLPQVSASPTSARAAELAGMTDELAEEFREAQYLAVDKDIKLFKNITSADGRREYLATFWGEIESGQRGVRDMTRALYLSRIKTANERFRAMGKLGWRSDRGRVHILFGEPDEIQRFPSSEGNKPYEIWNYYQLENGVIFAFIDRTGFGDYVLVHSTKRGELQDEGWERYLH